MKLLSELTLKCVEFVVMSALTFAFVFVLYGLLLATIFLVGTFIAFPIFNCLFTILGIT